MKEILFSNLTLDLKKQFVYFLAKHNIDFHQLKNSKFMETKIRIVGKKGKPTRIVIKPKDIWHLANRKPKVSKYHINCTQDAWRQGEPDKDGRRRQSSPKRSRTKKGQKLPLKGRRRPDGSFGGKRTPERAQGGGKGQKSGNGGKRQNTYSKLHRDKSRVREDGKVKSGLAQRRGRSKSKSMANLRNKGEEATVKKSHPRLKNDHQRDQFDELAERLGYTNGNKEIQEFFNDTLGVDDDLTPTFNSAKKNQKRQKSRKNGKTATKNTASKNALQSNHHSKTRLNGDKRAAERGIFHDGHGTFEDYPSGSYPGEIILPASRFKQRDQTVSHFLNTLDENYENGLYAKNKNLGNQGNFALSPATKNRYNLDECFDRLEQLEKARDRLKKEKMSKSRKRLPGHSSSPFKISGLARHHINPNDSQESSGRRSARRNRSKSRNRYGEENGQKRPKNQPTETKWERMKAYDKSRKERSLNNSYIKARRKEELQGRSGASSLSGAEEEPIVHQSRHSPDAQGQGRRSSTNFNSSDSSFDLQKQHQKRLEKNIIQRSRRRSSSLEEGSRHSSLIKVRYIHDDPPQNGPEAQNRHRSVKSRKSNSRYTSNRSGFSRSRSRPEGRGNRIHPDYKPGKVLRRQNRARERSGSKRSEKARSRSQSRNRLSPGYSDIHLHPSNTGRVAQNGQNEETSEDIVKIVSGYFKDSEYYVDPNRGNYSSDDGFFSPAAAKKYQKNHRSQRSGKRSRTSSAERERALRGREASPGGIDRPKIELRHLDGRGDRSRSRSISQRQLEKERLEELFRIKKLREDKLNRSLNNIYRNSRSRDQANPFRDNLGNRGVGGGRGGEGGLSGRHGEQGGGYEGGYGDENEHYSFDRNGRNEGEYETSERNEEIIETRESDLYQFEIEAAKLMDEKFGHLEKPKKSKNGRKQQRSTVKKTPQGHRDPHSQLQSPSKRLRGSSTTKKSWRKIRGVPTHAERRNLIREQNYLQKDEFFSPERGGLPRRRGSRSRSLARNSRSPTRRSLSRARRELTSPENINYFRNRLGKDQIVGVKVGLDMLDTDELLNYYRELVQKGKRDFITHHRQQNTIKKLENF